MDLLEALAHANCSAALSASPAHVAEAIQVLACRVAELEAENERVHAELTEYGDKYAAAQRQLAEPTGTEWGVRSSDAGRVANWGTSEAAARLSRGATSWDLVTRTAPGPWRVAT